MQKVLFVPFLKKPLEKQREKKQRGITKGTPRGMQWKESKGKIRQQASAGCPEPVREPPLDA